MSARRSYSPIATPEGDYIPRSLNHGEEIFYQCGENMTPAATDATWDAYVATDVFNEHRFEYVQSLRRPTRRRISGAQRAYQQNQLYLHNMRAAGLIDHAIEVRQNESLSMQALDLQQDLVSVLRVLTAKGERARIQGRLNRVARLNRAKQEVISALRGGLTRDVVLWSATQEIGSSTEEELEEEVMPSCPSSQDSSMDRLPEPVFALNDDWD